MIIKQIPEDFIVDEVINLKLTNKKTNYSIFKLTKTNWDMFKIIDVLSRNLNTKNKFIGYAGNKDKLAITTQCISFYKIPKERIERTKINGVKLEFQGHSYERINLGDLEGNNFTITIRGLNKKSKIPGSLNLENYFGEQRFGNKSNTHLVGKAIIKKDFKKACELLDLKVSNNDYVGELRKQPRRLLRFYISSYQAFLWNRLLSARLSKEKDKLSVKTELGELVFIKSKLDNFEVPLVSFDSESNEELENILKEENILLREFIISQMPELTTETVMRKAFIEVKNIISEYSEDELNKNKLKVVIKFFLPKGCYATMLIKRLETYLN